jgi:hypothetical protein
MECPTFCMMAACMMAACPDREGRLWCAPRLEEAAGTAVLGWLVY